MTDRFMSDSSLRTAYGITGEDETWENTFSKVSLENILMYIVAVCAWTLEVMMDNFKEEVNAKVSQSIVASVAWYHRACLAFQLGDELVYNESTGSYGYQNIDIKKRIISYAAVRDRGGSVQILVSKKVGNRPAVLSIAEMTAFSAYINKIKIAGITMSISSIPADKIKIALIVQIDPQILGLDGKRLDDGKLVVVDAINQYLEKIVYGGTFNKTKLIDSVQNVAGVIDITLVNVMAKSVEDIDYKNVSGNNYISAGGAFTTEGLEESITYVV